MTATILLVEDEEKLARFVELELVHEGYRVEKSGNGRQALEMALKNQYDLILLDIMLPGINGYELMEYIRPMGIPVIFITAKNSLDDRMKGLTSGAEDYLVKPFEVVELLARINIVLRRYNKTETELHFKDLDIDVENRTVTRDGNAIELTPKEFDLLTMFVRNLNITLYRERLYESVWEAEWMGDTRTLDLHVQRLRRKLGLKENLKSVYNMGYRLVEDDKR